MVKNVLNITRLPLGSHFTVTGNFNLNMMLKIYFQNLNTAYGLIKVIKGFYIRLSALYNSPNKNVMPVKPFSPVQGRFEYGDGRITNHHNSAEPCPIKTTKWWLIVLGFFECGLPVSKELKINLRLQLEPRWIAVIMAPLWQLEVKMKAKTNLRPENEFARSYYEIRQFGRLCAVRSCWDT